MRLSSRPLRCACALLLAVSLSGCFSLSIRDNTQGLAAIEQRQNFYVAGLLGDPLIDLTSICPHGTSRFEEVFTPGDILYHVITVGIYTPKTVRIECRVG